MAINSDRSDHAGGPAPAAEHARGPVFFRLRGVTKSFAGTVVLRDVDLDVHRGKIHGLLGENGSGKSTLIKVLAGYHVPDHGKLESGGQVVDLPLPLEERRRLGFAFVHQHLGLVPAMTVTENLRLGEFAAPANPLFYSQRRASREVRRELLEYGVDVDPSVDVSTLRAIDRARVAIVRAMTELGAGGRNVEQEGGLLVLDEPTAFLARDEVAQLFALMRRFAARGGSVLFVSHDLDEVKEVTDHVTVLRDGVLVGQGETASLSKDELISMIVGRSLDKVERRASAVSAGSTFAVLVKGLCSERLTDVSVDVRPGEIFGVTGLLGSGYEDIPYCLYGGRRALTGQLVLDGSEVALAGMTPTTALALGMILIPSQRLAEAAVGGLSVAENIGLPFLRDYWQRGVIRNSLVRRQVRASMDDYDVRPRQPDAEFATLSGGNQQKAVLAKWFATRPRLILLCEPTQGVDVGARQQIYREIRSQAAGAVTICASSDHEELAVLCDRVGIVAGGALVDVLSGDDLTKEQVTEACLRAGAPADPADPAPGGKEVSR